MSVAELGRESGLVTYTDPKGYRRTCPTAWGPTCKRRCCPRCGTPWGLDQRKRLAGNLEEFGGAVTVIAITAPGSDVLPCAPETCGDKGEHRQRGKRGCRVEGEAAKIWCESLPYRWSRLRDAARRAVKRAGLEAPTLAQVWELQVRGMPHVHIAIPYETDEQKEAARVYAEALDRLAPRWDFGFVDTRLVEWKSGAAAGYYLAGYLVGGRGHKPQIREAVRSAPATRLPAVLVYVSRTLTQVTGLTMRNLRRVRHVIAASKGLCPWPEWQSVEEFLAVKQLVRRIFGERAPPVRARPTLADYLLAAEYPPAWVPFPLQRAAA
jgi:hypothetical protein